MATETSQRAGVRCPRCNCGVSRVYYTRGRNGVEKRVRICGSPICGAKFITTEKVSGS
jgi:hypothetical protein